MHQGAYFFALHDALEVSDGVHVEDDDGEVVLLAHAGGGEVHDLEAAAQHFVVGDVGELGGCGVFLGVGGVDAVDAGAFEHDVGFDLDAAQAGACVGGEEGVARPGGHDDYFACLHALDGLPLAVEFAYGLHADGGQHAGLDAGGRECRTQGEAVDDGGQHAHLVALDAVEAFAGAAQSAEDVASADDDAYLYAHVADFFYLCCVLGKALLVDAVLPGAHEAFAAELQ